MANDVPLTSEQESRQVAEQARQTEWEGKGVRSRFIPWQVRGGLDLSVPPRARGTPAIHEVLHGVARFHPRQRRLRGDRPDRRVPRGGRRRSPQARRLRHEDPDRVRRARLHRRRVLQGDGDGRELRRQHLRAPLRAPVDRCAAAAQALRHARAEEKVPAALAKGAISAFALDRAARRLRPGEPCRRPPRRSATTTC